MVRASTTIAVVAAGLLIAPVVFAQTSHPNAPGGSAPAMVPKAALSQQDKDFVKDAAEGGMAEVELSKIAEKSENPEVKRFAERMVQDHTAPNAELTTIAAGLGARKVARPRGRGAYAASAANARRDISDGLRAGARSG